MLLTWQVSEARIEGTSQETLNGKVAASAVYDSSSARYVVEGVSEQPIAIKPANLVLPPSTRVSIVSLQSRPELNGRACRVVGSDGIERYVVELAETGEQLKLKYGAVVTLHALEDPSEL
jgi:hypothetical protein